jgi:hypothetical protein
MCTCTCMQGAGASAARRGWAPAGLPVNPARAEQAVKTRRVLCAVPIHSTLGWRLLPAVERSGSCPQLVHTVCIHTRRSIYARLTITPPADQVAGPAPVANGTVFEKFLLGRSRGLYLVLRWRKRQGSLPGGARCRGPLWPTSAAAAATACQLAGRLFSPWPLFPWRLRQSFDSAVGGQPPAAHSM